MRLPLLSEYEKEILSTALKLNAEQLLKNAHATQPPHQGWLSRANAIYVMLDKFNLLVDHK